MTTHKEESLRVAEIIEATTFGFTSQCYHLFQSPPLGVLVRTREPAIYAVIHSVSTRGIDPGRPIIPRGQDEETEEAIFRNNPQLSQLLATQFQALTLGHIYNGTVYHHLPSSPPQVHSFVYQCTPQEIASFTASPDFLHLLSSASIPSVDEVIASCLREASTAHKDPHAFFVKAGKTLARELGSDTGRLNSILKRAAP